MAKKPEPVTSKALEYLSERELGRIDKAFDRSLKDVTCLVFWTGVSPDRVKHWAERHRLPTLTIAMGSLYSDHNVGGARYGKSTKAWAEYMKGASCRFAEYACRAGRRVVVLTPPPPNTYSRREKSNFRCLEEPILKGDLGTSGTLQMDHVHPTVAGAADFRYQTWPLNESSMWAAFSKAPLLLKPINPAITTTASSFLADGLKSPDLCLVVMRVISERPEEGESRMLTQQSNLRVSTLQQEQPKVELQPACLKKKKKKKKKKKSKSKMNKKAKREQEELEQEIARKKKDAKRQRAALEQQKARKKKEAWRQRVALEERKARQKEAKCQRAALEQERARKKKEVKRQRAALEQQKAHEKKEARRQRVALEERRARERKEAKHQRAVLEQQKAQEKKEAKRQRAALEQEEARKKKEARRQRVELEQRKAREKEAKRQRTALEQEQASLPGDRVSDKADE